MWDEDDHFARWVQGLCAIPLLAWAAIGTYLLFSSPFGWYHSSMFLSTSTIGAAFLAVRCLWYALTGRDNVNRDDY